MAVTLTVTVPMMATKVGALNHNNAIITAPIVTDENKPNIRHGFKDIKDDSPSEIPGTGAIEFSALSRVCLTPCKWFVGRRSSEDEWPTYPNKSSPLANSASPRKSERPGTEAFE